MSLNPYIIGLFKFKNLFSAVKWENYNELMFEVNSKSHFFPSM